MIKIGTHDSVTGEKGGTFLSWLVAPFSITQSKTLKEQYDAGCRLFDIRVKLHRGKWKCAHGLWVTKRTAIDIFDELNKMPGIMVSVTLEGGMDDVEKFRKFMKQVKKHFTSIAWWYTAVKYGKDSTGIKVKYTIIDKGEVRPSTKQGFLPLDGSTWHTYLPIPYLWKKLYNDEPKFNEKDYLIVDFL
jgi:hypothetical protein